MEIALVRALFNAATRTFHHIRTNIKLFGRWIHSEIFVIKITCILSEIGFIKINSFSLLYSWQRNLNNHFTVPFHLGMCMWCGVLECISKQTVVVKRSSTTGIMANRSRMKLNLNHIFAIIRT